MSKLVDLRKEKLNDLVGTEQHFVGKIARGTSYEENGVRKVLVSPLYVELEDSYSYIGHAWMVLPEDYISKIGYTIDFKGEVYTYKKASGAKSCGIKFASMQNIEMSESYNNLSMLFVEASGDDMARKRYVNNNISIITAFENGENLKQSKKNTKMRDFTKRVRHAQLYGKRADPDVWNALAWSVQ